MQKIFTLISQVPENYLWIGAGVIIFFLLLAIIAVRSAKKEEREEKRRQRAYWTPKRMEEYHKEVWYSENYLGRPY